MGKGYKPFPCRYCDHGIIATEGEYKRHMRLHPPETRRLVCEDCGQVFDRSNTYARHRTRQHDSEERRQEFWSRVDKNGPVPAHAPELGPCWVYTFAKTDKGYGNYKWPGGAIFSAHRYAYLTEVGEHDSDLELDHLCRNKPCVRPSHLEAVTHDENTRRMRAAQDMFACQTCGTLCHGRAALKGHIRIVHEKRLPALTARVRRGVDES